MNRKLGIMGSGSSISKPHESSSDPVPDNNENLMNYHPIFLLRLIPNFLMVTMIQGLNVRYLMMQENQSFKHYWTLLKQTHCTKGTHNLHYSNHVWNHNVQPLNKLNDQRNVYYAMLLRKYMQCTHCMIIMAKKDGNWYYLPLVWGSNGKKNDWHGYILFVLCSYRHRHVRAIWYTAVMRMESMKCLMMMTKKTIEGERRR